MRILLHFFRDEGLHHVKKEAGSFFSAELSLIFAP
jgi:hypothetical protein